MRTPEIHPLSARPLAWALERLAPGLWAEQLAGESPAEARARREAAAALLLDALADYAARPLNMTAAGDGAAGTGVSR